MIFEVYHARIPANLDLHMYLHVLLKYNARVAGGDQQRAKNALKFTNQTL